MRIKFVLLTALLCACSSLGFAQSKTMARTPDLVVKNLYAAQKAGTGPFFQNKNRAIVDRYFTKDFADVIWQDAVDANGEVGALDFDPLYHAQDVHITAFKIGKPEYGEGNGKLADVAVTFKNMGAAETILFRLLQDSRQVWKISDIYYPTPKGETLKTILINAMQAARESSEIRTVDFKNFDYGALCAGKHQFLDLSDVGNLVLKQGRQEHGDEANYANLGSVQYVDFNGDGTDEAFIVINGQTAGSSGGYLAAYVFAYQNGAAKKIWTQCEENSAAMLQGKSILFTRPEWVGNDAHCCFRFVTTDTYAWKGANLALISTRRKKTGRR